MSFSFKIHAAPGVVFAPTSFDGQVGRHIALRVGAAVHEAVIVAAEVEPNGASAELTLDNPEPIELVVADDWPNLQIGRGLKALGW